MSPSQRLLLVVGGVLVLLVFAVFIIYPLFRPAATPAVTPTTTPVVVTDPSQLQPAAPDNAPAAPIVATPAVPKSEAAQRSQAEGLARLFVERFGSYSNYSNFENITSLEALMTPVMLTYAQGLMKQPTAPTAGYRGVTQSIVSLDTASFTLGSKASIHFVAQQQLQQGLNTKPTATYKEGHIDLVYQDGSWLVDGLYYNK